MTLDEIVTFCRKSGVAVWKGPAEQENLHGLVELHFGPPPAEEDVKDVDKKPALEKRRGKDGRTAAEQRELYNRVIDAEE